MNILTISEANQKLSKSRRLGYENLGLFLTPYIGSSDIVNRAICPNASKYCSAVCLWESGHGKFKNTKKARRRKTNFFTHAKEQFKQQLLVDLRKLYRKLANCGNYVAVRLNGTSDIRWEQEFPEIFEAFPKIQFYDYTKIFSRIVPGYKLPANYKLVFSYSGANLQQCRDALTYGVSIAVVAKCKNSTLKKLFGDYKIVNGDYHDLVFLHKSPVIIRLKPKGKAKKDKGPFVVTDDMLLNISLPVLTLNRQDRLVEKQLCFSFMSR